jgi:hypothetical protein
MNDGVKAVIAAALACLFGSTEGCFEQTTGSRSENYVLDIHACSSTATSKAQAVACRRSVNWRYGLCDAPYPAVTPCDEGD